MPRRDESYVRGYASFAGQRRLCARSNGNAPKSGIEEPDAKYEIDELDECAEHMRAALTRSAFGGTHGVRSSPEEAKASEHVRKERDHEQRALGGAHDPARRREEESSKPE